LPAINFLRQQEVATATGRSSECQLVFLAVLLRSFRRKKRDDCSESDSRGAATFVRIKAEKNRREKFHPA
jgi:hypothetical protein